MKDVVLDEVIKELNWKEKIIVKGFRRTFIRICNITRIKIVNNLLR